MNLAVGRKTVRKITAKPKTMRNVKECSFYLALTPIISPMLNVFFLAYSSERGRSLSFPLNGLLCVYFFTDVSKLNT